MDMNKASALEQEGRNEMITQQEENKNEEEPRCEPVEESQQLSNKNDKSRSLSSDTEGGNSGRNSDALESESIEFGITEGNKNIDPYHRSSNGTTSHSRFSNDFEHIKSLGKGGFGDVLKVRNKLDGRFYAIKRIPLKKRNQQITERITQEVKLLSILNHENIVRYYNSWTEVSEKPARSSEGDDDEEEEDDEDEEDDDGNVVEDRNEGGDGDEDIVFGNDEDGDGNVGGDGNEGGDEEDEDEENLLKTSEKKENTTTVSNVDHQQIQYLFIQMEYCEKSTLRNCIDGGLYKEVDRIWRLFREIIEGLNHLHDQGIIHRDLKPENIFLDSNDHVKIGDFGLARIDPTVKKSLGAAKLPNTELTGNIGTFFYVSPEVKAPGEKFDYSQKVDSYSLGIIFFEMCYPFTTGMERTIKLTDLRSPEIKFPPDFQVEQQTKIIKWLLSHDPNSRPTTKELLQSDLLPPLQMEEATMNELFRSTISNPQSRSYHRLVNALFSQPFSADQDKVYDSDTCKPFSSPKLHLIQKSVADTIEKIFQFHGAIKFSTPLLTPKCHLYESNEQYVCFVDHKGGLVGLPCDQRVPFARYVARSNTQSMKRYCLDKVYQEKKLFGLHPKDMTECAFDIVTPSHASLIPESELLAVSSQIIHEFPILRERNYYFRVNHTSLVKAVLLFCGIREEIYEAVQLCLRDFQHKKTMRRQSLESKCGVTFTEQSAANFFNLLDFEGSYNKVNSLLRPVVKSKGQASILAKQGLHELETIINYAESLDVKLEIKVTVGLIYNPTQYDGFIFQVLYEHRKKKRLLGDVLAAGGRYQKLLRKFKVDKGEDCVIPSAVGVSLAFEKIVSAVLETAEVPSSHDIVVCSVGHQTMLKEALPVVKELWAAGLRAEIFYDTVQDLEEVYKYCHNNNISFMVYLIDGESVMIRWMEKDKNMEKKVSMVEMVEFLQQKLSASKEYGDHGN